MLMLMLMMQNASLALQYQCCSMCRDRFYRLLLVLVLVI